MPDIQQRIADVLLGESDPPLRWDQARYLADLLVSELGLKERSVTGHMDNHRRVHMGPIEGIQPKRYVAYSTGWFDA